MYTQTSDCIHSKLYDSSSYTPLNSGCVTSLTFPKLIMKKALIAMTALTASALIAGCANVPREAHRINLITLDEAEANHCKSLGWVGSVSVLLINGKARNTAVILKKAVKMPGATHIAYTKGEAGYATTRAQVLS